MTRRKKSPGGDNGRPEPSLEEQTQQLATALPVLFGDLEVLASWNRAAKKHPSAARSLKDMEPERSAAMLQAYEQLAQVVRRRVPYLGEQVPDLQGEHDPLIWVLMYATIIFRENRFEPGQPVPPVSWRLPLTPFVLHPDNSTASLPGEAITPAAAQVLADFVKARQKSGPGRPKRTGRYRSAAECERDLGKTIASLVTEGKEPSEAEVGRVLSASERQIRRWLDEFRLPLWEELRKKYGVN